METALKNTQERLLADLLPEGRWEGELSSSALATAVASFALKRAGKTDVAARGFHWLETHQNADGGWGDSPESPSNFTATLLCRCALDEKVGSPQEVAQSVLDFYGNDRTFSVPILTMCMLSGKLSNDWKQVPQLPFELAVLPHRVFKILHLPVVSYAMPALIAIGLVRHKNGPAPFSFVREKTVSTVLHVLEKIQPESGGFLEAAPLTGFVAMSLIGAGLEEHPVTENCLRFLEETVRADGSWPIDVNLSTWVTSLSARAVADVLSDPQRASIRTHLLNTQWKTVHPFTNSAPGGWGWTCEQGAVPDADDTAAALIALRLLGQTGKSTPHVEQTLLSAQQGMEWLLNLQNRDGGMPTFCKGWGRLPFDRSCPDLTAHAIRAFAVWKQDVDSRLWKKMERSMRRGVHYLEKQQRPDGSWVPLWFGNQNNLRKENPVYGTVRVLEALACMDEEDFPRVGKIKERGFHWLEKLDLATLCIEEVALVAGCTGKGSQHLRRCTKDGKTFSSSPVGLYFASLWYSEKLYPIIFSVEAFKWNDVESLCKGRSGAA